MSALEFDLGSDEEKDSVQGAVAYIEGILFSLDDEPVEEEPAALRLVEHEIKGVVTKTQLPETQVPALSSYAYDTHVPEVDPKKPLKTYRVQVDYGMRDRMVRGFSSYYMPMIGDIVENDFSQRHPIYAMLPLLTQGTTAPQMPPPKINDPNMYFNWSHLVDSWPLKSRRPCSHCMHPFESIPWMIPIKRIESYYKMDDSEHVFCSYPCTLRFLLMSGYPDRFMYVVFLNDIARNYFKWRGDLMQAPPRLWLEKMTIDEYRSLLVPPPFFEFATRDQGQGIDVARESKWMSEMTVLRPPFLSGTAIMEWVSNAVPRAYQATKVLVDAYKLTVPLSMGPLQKDGSEGSMNLDLLKELAKDKESRDGALRGPLRGPWRGPWRVEGLSLPKPEEIEHVDAHRIVLPPVDPGAPALIDEISRMRKDLAENKPIGFCEEARGASYVQEIEGVVRGKKKIDETTYLTQTIESSLNKAKRTKGRKRGRDEE